MTCEWEFLNLVPEKYFRLVATMLNSSSHNQSSSAHSTLINPTIVQVLKKYDDLERRSGYFCQRKQKVKTKFIDLDHAGNDKLLNRLL